ncbi:hypothetical protein OSTOST_22841, partial [Ostertagia ostertagi]
MAAHVAGPGGRKFTVSWQRRRCEHHNFVPIPSSITRLSYWASSPAPWLAPACPSTLFFPCNFTLAFCTHCALFHVEWFVMPSDVADAKELRNLDAKYS